jgi:gas vesicle protein
MRTNGEPKFSHLLIGLGLGAIGGLIAAILAQKETREALRERSGKSLDYLNQQMGKLRETTDEIVQQGKKLLACNGSDSDDHPAKGKRQSYKEDRRETSGG